MTKKQHYQACDRLNWQLSVWSCVRSFVNSVLSATPIGRSRTETMEERQKERRARKAAKMIGEKLDGAQLITLMHKCIMKKE